MSRPDQGKAADPEAAKLQDSIDEFSHPLRSGRPDQDARTRAEKPQKDVGERQPRDSRH